MVAKRSPVKRVYSRCRLPDSFVMEIVISTALSLGEVSLICTNDWRSCRLSVRGSSRVHGLIQWLRVYRQCRLPDSFVSEIVISTVLSLGEVNLICTNDLRSCRLSVPGFVEGSWFRSMAEGLFSVSTSVSFVSEIVISTALSLGEVNLICTNDLRSCRLSVPGFVEGSWSNSVAEGL